MVQKAEEVVEKTPERLRGEKKKKTFKKLKLVNGVRHYKEVKGIRMDGIKVIELEI